MILTDDELRLLTRRKRHKAQARVLRALGIPFDPRPDGSLIVYRVHLPYATQSKEQASPALHL